MIRNSWISPLDSHRALTGTWLAFSLRRNSGMVWSRALANRISAHSRVQDSNAPARETISPTLMSTAPQWPTTLSSTPAIDGFFRPDSWAWARMPWDSTLTSTSSRSTPMKPTTVALPTSLRFSARAEKMLAPSMPMNTQTVTSIMLRTWFITVPRSLLPAPQKSAVNTSSLKATAQITMNSASGTILAMVVRVLMNAASLIPRSTRKCRNQSSTEAQMIAGRVLPSPNTGKKKPRVLNSSTM
ncbi:hypothetical protein D9M68_713290 [compost metagenome]